MFVKENLERKKKKKKAHCNSPNFPIRVTIFLEMKSLLFEVRRLLLSLKEGFEKEEKVKQINLYSSFL